MDEVSLRTLFHGALDEVAPPKPWLAESVREELRRLRRSETARRARTRLSPRVRWLVATALVVLIAASAAAATIAIYQQMHHVVPVIPRPAAVRPECVSSGVHMVNKTTGWNGPSRTTDGGKTWKDQYPPEVPGGVKGGNSFCGLDATHAWATSGAGNASYQPDHIVVQSTQDGGATWQDVGSINVPVQVSQKFNVQVELGFFDDQHGWLLFEYVTAPIQRWLYATSDAGVHWSVVNRSRDLGLGRMAEGCFVHGITFESLQHGWLTWDCFTGGVSQGNTLNGGVVATTTDGGKSWKPVSLAGVPTTSDYLCGATAPILDVDGHAVIQVKCGGIGHGGWLAIYSSADGGRTWTPHVISQFPDVDFLNADEGWYFWQDSRNGPNTLYHTTDGGAHWKVVATGLFAGRVAGGVTFVDEQTGFVAVSDSPAPWWTTDGGKTWALQGKYHSVGDTICANFADPGAGSLPQNVKMVSPTVGWATGARRTTDGGATWAKVAPPPPKDQSKSYGEFFLDADHAWVVDTVGSNVACADHFQVYATADGGSSWMQLASTPVTQLSGQDLLAGSWGVSVEFVNPQVGWIYVQPIRFSIATNVTNVLYQTSDGGHTWAVIASPATWTAGDCSAAGMPYFSSPTTGWIGAMCSGAARSSIDIMVTRDGGQTWKNVEFAKNFCTAPAYPTGCPGPGGPLPQFVDPLNGWWMNPDGSPLLVTSDGGQTWKRAGLPHLSYIPCQGKYGPTTCPTSYFTGATFLSPSEGWLLVTEAPGNGPPTKTHLERTTDGGRTWSVIYTTGGYWSGAMTFVDPQNGFLWDGQQLFRTVDGGRSWTKVHFTYS